MKKYVLMLAAWGMLTFGMLSCNKNDETTNNSPNSTNQTNQTSGEWIDLELPSGLLWYSVNLGSTTPEGYGYYYAWGETETKDVYDEDTYRWFSHDSDGRIHIIKYNIIDRNGTVDNKTTLDVSDDAATSVIGMNARIPTKGDWLELINNTDCVWSTLNGVTGYRFTSHGSGQSIFLPAAGFKYNSDLHDAVLGGGYMSSSLYTDVLDDIYEDLYDTFDSWACTFSSDTVEVRPITRGIGYPVRAVSNRQY